MCCDPIRADSTTVVAKMLGFEQNWYEIKETNKTIILQKEKGEGTRKE